MNKYLKFIIYTIIGIAIFLSMFIIVEKNIYFNIVYSLNNPGSGTLKIYYSNEENIVDFFDEDHTRIINYELDSSDYKKTSIKLSADELKNIRIDFEGGANISIKDISISKFGIDLISFSPKDIIDEFDIRNDVKLNINDANELSINIIGGDPFIGKSDISMIRIHTIVGGFIFLVISISIFVYKRNLKKIKFIFKHEYNFNWNHALIIGFFISIIAPGITFYTPNVNESNENRSLSEKPVLNLYDLNNYPKEYEKYYTDNLPFKDTMVKLNSIIKFNLFGISPFDYVIKGKEGWLFYNSKYKNDEDTLSDYMGINLFTKDQLDEIKNNLLEMNNFANENGAEFCLMIPSNKSQIYSQFMPEKYIRLNSFTRADQLVEFLKNNTDINIIYPKNKLT